MRNLSLLVLALLFSNALFGQRLPLSINKAPVNWSAWEVESTEKEKLEVIESLSKHVEMEWGLQHYTYTLWNVIDSYHLVDFNKDGLVDVIYNGFVGKRNNGVMFYENRGEKYIKFMGFLGDIIEIWESDSWVPLSFKIWNYRCCGNYVDFIETYVPKLTYQLNVKYELSSKIAIVDGMVVAQSFETLQPFKTVAEIRLFAYPTKDTGTYTFAFTDRPYVDSVPHSRFFHHRGSVTAWFDTNATGFILKEQIVRDTAWYFVMMSSYNRTRGVFCARGDNNGSDYFMLGWIKPEGIELVPMKVARGLMTKEEEEGEERSESDSDESVPASD